MASLGTPPGRLNLRVVAGEPVDVRVPILDGNGATVLTATGPEWTIAAQVRTTFDAATALYTFTTSLSVGIARIQADGDDTADWLANWTDLRYPWDLVITDPAGDNHVICSGWVTVYPTVTR